MSASSAQQRFEASSLVADRRGTNSAIVREAAAFTFRLWPLARSSRAALFMVRWRNVPMHSAIGPGLEALRRLVEAAAGVRGRDAGGEYYVVRSIEEVRA